MTVLDFARGPGFFGAFTILIVGLAWRTAGLVLLRFRRDLSKPRPGSQIIGGLRTVAMRSVPPHDLEKHIVFQHLRWES